MNRTLIGVIVAMAVVVGVVFLTNEDAAAPGGDSGQQQTAENGQPEGAGQENQEEQNQPEQADGQPAAHEIAATDSGFSPNSLEIRRGDTVRFTNNGSAAVWPASAPHPTHTDYPEFDPKAGIAPGDSWSFTFNKAGTWRYHDHLNPTRFGSITVQE